MIRPRCLGSTPSASRVVADVFEAEIPEAGQREQDDSASGSHGVTENRSDPAAEGAERHRHPPSRACDAPSDEERRRDRARAEERRRSRLAHVAE